MTNESNLQPFSMPHDIESIIDSLKLDVDPKLKRRISDAVAMFFERDRAVEDRLTQQPGTLPLYTTNPSVLQDGMQWINQTTGKVRARVNGLTVDLN